MDRVVTFVGGPFHDRREYMRDLPSVIEKVGEDGQVHRYERWFGWKEGTKPAAFESLANATYVLRGLSPDDLFAAQRTLSSPPFITKEDE
ncbi:hypothetical protein [Pseudoxanthomonas sp. PXM02]|uniref:hypothetical protein n=1 Tax=Pseudoxanthomonas sp. PXM02 TaxID=2769294 RepID=UPI00177AC903|nr:hypothetical protein [Pseudoxanthomonas sp. PXM02]MBD9478503.1 hypothetical protein [Pseudoxanthomonas sp. PXM02]